MWVFVSVLLSFYKFYCFDFKKFVVFLLLFTVKNRRSLQFTNIVHLLSNYFFVSFWSKVLLEILIILLNSFIIYFSARIFSYISFYHCHHPLDLNIWKLNHQSNYLNDITRTTFWMEVSCHPKRNFILKSKYRKEEVIRYFITRNLANLKIK